MMTEFKFRSVLLVALLVCFIILGGCAKTTPSKFYVLSPLSKAASEGRNGFTIGLGPVELAEYFDRPQIITRVSPNQIELAEFDRWAEPLKRNFSRVLAENLSILLGTDRVISYPWPRSVPVKYQIKVEVLRFDGAPGKNVSLVALWTILRGSDKEMILTKKT